MHSQPCQGMLGDTWKHSWDNGCVAMAMAWRCGAAAALPLQLDAWHLRPAFSRALSCKLAQQTSMQMNFAANQWFTTAMNRGIS